MSSPEWRVVYQTIRKVNRQLPRPHRRPEYSDVLIVAMYLWAVAHDRPQGWACRRDSYGSVFRPRRLPSQSRFSRRLRDARCHHILQGVYNALAQTDRPTPVTFLDARPLIVGSCSKDRSARAGRVYGGFARGYKLHQLVAEDHRVLCWSVTPLNESEAVEALQLVEATTGVGECVLADGLYDDGRLYENVEARGGLLIAGLRPSRLVRPPRAGRNSPARLRAVKLWQDHIARFIYRDRWKVELAFAHQSGYGGGLAPLPAWVRSLPRVRRWVGAKLILHHAHLRIRRLSA